ncbi:MAG: peptidoglycan recognition protein family protein [Defluviitaleaceae bacterium]|nr:peptidoglycan recognition protein family protein [Defluviitaleaceae bacterium]MCL2274453.1 peptidoglycan recognition protein family protein [Defluviitaleaceae bacterium]
MNIPLSESPNRNPGRQGNIPDHIVLHTTGASFGSALNTIKNPANQVSYHFVISAAGEIVQLVKIKDTAWSNGTTNAAGDKRNNQLSTVPAIRERKKNANLYTISIGFGDMPAGNPSPQQLTAVVNLIKYIQAEVEQAYNYQIPLNRDRIIGHCEVSPLTRAFCPGKNFPFDEIIRLLNAASNPREVELEINGNIQKIGGFIENGATWVRLTDIVKAMGGTAVWDNRRRIPVIKFA